MMWTRWTLRTFLGIFTAALSAVAVLLFFPAVPARFAADRWAPSGWTVGFASLRGNPFSGYRARELRVRGPGIDLSVQTLAARPSWRAIRRREWVLEFLKADRPVLRLDPGAFHPPISPGSGAASRKTAVWAARRVGVTDGDFSLAGSSVSASDIDASLSISSGGIHVSSLSFEIVGHSIDIRGTAAFQPPSWIAAADIDGAVKGKAATKGSTDAWSAEIALAHEPGLKAAGAATGGRDKLRARGRLEGKGKLSPHVEAERLWLKAKAGGRTFDPSWNFDAGYEGLIVKSVRSQSGRLTASGRGALRAAAHFRAQGTEGNGRRLDDLRVGLEGTLLSHKVSVDAAGDGITASARGRGRWAEGQWRTVWRSLDAEWQDLWRSSAPFTTTVAGEGVTVEGLALTGEKGRLTLDGMFRPKGRSRVHLRAEGLALDPLHAHGWVKQPLAGTLHLEARMEKTPDLSTGTVAFRVEGLTIQGLRAGEMTGRLVLSERSLKWTGVELISPSGVLTSEGSVPWPLRAPLNTFTLRVRAPRFDPGPWLLSLFSIETKNPDLSGDITFSRRNGAMEARGGLRFAAEEVKVPRLGGAFHPVLLALKGEGERLVVTEGTAGTKGGRAQLTGGIGRNGPDLSFMGRHLPFRAGNMAGRADADLALEGSWNRPRIAGTIFVRRAEYVPPPKKKKKGAPPPKPPPARPAAPSALALDVALRAERDVWYKRGDTAVELKTSLKIEKEPHEPARVYGTAGVVRGDYFFYGSRFKVEEGNALFAGETPIDPALSVRAVHAAGDIDVLLSVGGTLRRPEISLTSNPPLEETDIVSVLATGRPATAQGGDGAAGDGAQAAAQSLMAGYLSGKLEDRLRAHIPLDVLRVDLDPENQAGLTVGKNVTDRLYVAVEQTLGADGARRLRSEYVLTDWLNLEGSSTGEGSTVVDLLFKFGFK